MQTLVIGRLLRLSLFAIPQCVHASDTIRQHDASALWKMLALGHKVTVVPERLPVYLELNCSISVRSSTIDQGEGEENCLRASQACDIEIDIIARAPSDVELANEPLTSR